MVPCAGDHWVLREGEQLQIGKGRKTWQENILHIQAW
jgi:hypothetical protein